MEMNDPPGPQRPSCPNRPSTQGCELVTWAVITVPLSTYLVLFLSQLYSPWLPLPFTVFPSLTLPHSPALLSSGAPQNLSITFGSYAKPKLRPQGPPRSSREQPASFQGLSEVHCPVWSVQRASGQGQSAEQTFPQRLSIVYSESGGHTQTYFTQSSTQCQDPGVDRETLPRTPGAAW